MISIPIAANVPSYRHQLSLFWENHVNVYGQSAEERAHAVIVMQTRATPDWGIGVPHTVANAWQHCYDMPYDVSLAPLNIQIGLQQVLHKFDDNAILELIDCDMFHLRKAPEYKPRPMQFITNNIYENWHLKSRKDNAHVIRPYLKTDNRYNGGFVPIIGLAKTFKIILEDWIDIHLSIYDENKGNELMTWWAGMYAFQAACANNGVKMTSQDNCYIPTVNTLKDAHYIVHYCCDERYFNKKKVLEDPSKFNVDELPDNLFYNRIRAYFSRDS